MGVIMRKTMKKTTILATALIFLGSNALILEAQADAHKIEKEKCYGVVQAGKNDCATKTSSCVGSSTIDGQKDAFIAVPKGLCGKLVGGSLTSE